MVLFICTDEARFNRAASSRIWYMSGELNHSRINTTIVIGEATSDRIMSENIIAVKPLISRGFIGNLLFLLQVYTVVLRVMFTSGIDSVIARGYSLSPLLILLKFWRKHIIYDFHGYSYKEQIVQGRRMRAKLTRPFDWLALTLADHILAIREELREDLPLKFRDKTLLLPNGVDLEVFTGDRREDILSDYAIPPDKKIVGFVGNWEAWLAFDDILDSAAYFDDDIQLIIIGAGKGLEKYRTAYPSILFTGSLPHQDTVALLKKTDVCLCPYSTQLIARNKSYRKVIEYLAAGKPIVVSDAPSREKFLKEGENTLLYKAGDPVSLAEKVKLILDDKNLCESMSRKNLELSREFSWSEVINRSGLMTILRSSQDENNT